MPVSAFLASLSPASASHYEDVEALRAMLGDAIDTAESSWNSFAVTGETFATYLGTIAEKNGECQRFWNHVSDLYLCCACADEAPQALKEFDVNCLEPLGGVLRRVTASDDEIAEVKQVLRTRLFVASPAAPAKIRSYLGRGNLRSWLRAAAVREAIAILRHHKKHTLFEADELLPDTGDVELNHFRELYTLEFKSALQSSFAELSVRERNVLRQVVLDGLSVGRVAKLHGVHRGSASRWLTDIREQLAIATKERLGAKLQLPAEELSSIMRLVDSRVDISLERILRAQSV